MDDVLIVSHPVDPVVANTTITRNDLPTLRRGIVWVGVRFGSTADVGLLKNLVRFTPESGRKSVITGHPHIDRLFLAINSLCGGYGAPALDRAQGSTACSGVRHTRSCSLFWA